MERVGIIPSDFSSMKIKLPDTYVEAYTGYWKELLASYIDMIKFGLSYYGIEAEINESDKTKMDFYYPVTNDKPRKYISSLEMKLPKTKGDFIGDQLMISERKIVHNFRTKNGKIEIVLYSNGETINYFFSLTRGRKEKAIQLISENGSLTYCEAVLRGEKDYPQKSISLMEKKDYHSFHAELNDFDGYDKAGKEKCGPLRRLDYYQNYYTPSNCGVSAIYCEKFGRFVALPGQTAAIKTEYNSYSENQLTSIYRRQGNYEAAEERVPNVAANPRCKETIEYVERDLDAALPGIVEFMRNNFRTYRYITEAERTSDEEFDQVRFLKLCELPGSERGIKLYRKNN